MSRIDWDRWAPLTGIVFVALVVVTFFLPGGIAADTRRPGLGRGRLVRGA